LAFLDTPHTDALALMLRLDSAGFHIALVTSRGEPARTETVSWLEQQGVRSLLYDLYMRPIGTYHLSGAEWKAQVVQELFLNRGLGVVCAFDDDPLAVQAYAEIGILAFQIHQPKEQL
jgi:hypothetical protein